MGTTLFVGKLPDPMVFPAISEFTSKALNLPSRPNRSFLSKMLGRNSGAPEVLETNSRWKNDTKNAVAIDSLNEASIMLFLEHSAKLEGLSDSNEAIEKSIWKNLPYWTQTIWLPLSNHKIKPTLVEEGDMPTLICTASGLLSDLKQIAEMSDKKLGKKPDGFDLMLSNSRAFYDKKDLRLDDDSTIRWIWFALQTGADLALQNDMPLWSSG